MNLSSIGIVDSEREAQAILTDLRRLGFGPQDISVLTPESGLRQFVRQRNRAADGALLGMLLGAGLGLILGWLASLGVLFGSLAGELHDAGPLLAAMSFAGTGAALGGVLGSLLGYGIPEVVTRHYRDRFARGRILIAVHVDSRDAQWITESVLTGGGAHDIMTARDAEAPARP